MHVNVARQTRQDQIDGGLMAIGEAEKAFAGAKDIRRTELEWRHGTQACLIEMTGAEDTDENRRHIERMKGGCIALRQIHESGCNARAVAKTRNLFEGHLAQLQSSADEQVPSLCDTMFDRSPTEAGWWISDARKLQPEEKEKIYQEVKTEVLKNRKGLSLNSKAIAAVFGIVHTCLASLGPLNEMYASTKVQYLPEIVSFSLGIIISQVLEEYEVNSEIKKYKQKDIKINRREYAHSLASNLDQD